VLLPRLSREAAATARQVAGDAGGAGGAGNQLLRLRSGAFAFVPAMAAEAGT
jgi:hypothetical protein